MTQKKALGELTPAERLVLRDPKKSRPTEMIKVTLLDLLARRVLRFEEREEQAGIFKKKATRVYLQKGPENLERTLKKHERILVECVPADGQISLDKYFKKVASRVKHLETYKMEYLVQPLVRDGLLEHKKTGLFFSEFSLTDMGGSLSGQLTEMLRESDAHMEEWLQNDLGKGKLLLALIGTKIVLLQQLLAIKGAKGELSAAPDSSFDLHPGFVGVDGKQFIAPNGAPLQLKGINLGNWLVPEGYMFKFDHATSPRLIYTAIEQLVGDRGARRFWNQFRDTYISREDVRYIKSLGFNSVRVPLHYRLFMSDNHSDTLNGPGFELLDRLIAWCREAGLYVILDMHAAPGGQTGDNIDDSWGHPFLYDSEHNQELLIRIWQTLAERYSAEPAVLGYDLLNEPIAHFVDIAYFNPKLEPLFKRIAAAIREVDPNHIIILSGAQWGTNFDVLGAPFDGKLAYTFHTYWTSPVQDSIQRYVDFSDTHNVPLWLGESGENTDEWVAAMRQLLEENNIGWAFWPYKKIDSSSAVVSVPRTGAWDAVIAFANSPRASLADIRAHRPARDVINQALNDLLVNIRFENSIPNVGYIQALGLDIPEPDPDVADAR